MWIQTLKTGITRNLKTEYGKQLKVTISYSSDAHSMALKEPQSQLLSTKIATLNSINGMKPAPQGLHQPQALLTFLKDEAGVALGNSGQKSHR